MDTLFRLNSPPDSTDMPTAQPSSAAAHRQQCGATVAPSAFVYQGSAIFVRVEGGVEWQSTKHSQASACYRSRLQPPLQSLLLCGVTVVLGERRGR